MGCSRERSENVRERGRESAMVGRGSDSSRVG